jgi:hypothetical protein
MRSKMRRCDGYGGRTYLESFGTVNAPHTDSRHFSILAKESLELSLKPRNLLTKAFLHDESVSWNSW